MTRMPIWENAGRYIDPANSSAYRSSSHSL